MGEAMTDRSVSRVRDFWSRNINGLRFLPAFPKTAEEFRAAAAFRYRYHYHLPPLFDTIAAAHGGERLLEVGCGMGDDTSELARRGLDVTAVDLTEEAASCTLSRLKLLALSGSTLAANAERLPFADDRFDAAYSFGVLHHTPDTKRAIEEVRRVLKPGGEAFVMLYHRRSLNFLVHRLTGIPFDGTRGDPCPVESTYTKEGVRRLFDGFSHCRIEVDYLFGTGYRFANRLLPRFLHRILGRRIGWHLMIQAKK